MNTEAQRATLEMLSGQIRMAVVALMEKKTALEAQPPTGASASALSVVALRLDLLAKVELYLLRPIAEHYAYMERHEDSLQQAELSTVLESIEIAFLNKVMQGID